MNQSENLQIIFHALILAQNVYVLHIGKHKAQEKCDDCVRLYDKYKQAKDHYMSAINLYLDVTGEKKNA